MNLLTAVQRTEARRLYEEHATVVGGKVLFGSWWTWDATPHQRWIVRRLIEESLYSIPDE